MVSKQQGFTLIELVVVIVILGILAAAALPRFVSLQENARIAAVQGMAGAIRSASALVQAKYLAVGSTAATTVNIGTAGTPVNVAVNAITGIPTATGIVTALQDTTGFTVATGTPTTFTPTTGGSTTCRAEYDGTGGVASAVVGSC